MADRQNIKTSLGAINDTANETSAKVIRQSRDLSKINQVLESVDQRLNILLDKANYAIEQLGIQNNELSRNNSRLIGETTRLQTQLDNEQQFKTELTQQFANLTLRLAKFEEMSKTRLDQIYFKIDKTDD